MNKSKIPQHYVLFVLIKVCFATLGLLLTITLCTDLVLSLQAIKVFKDLSTPSPWFHCAHRSPGPWTFSDTSPLALLPCLSKMRGFSSTALQGPPWREDEGAVQVMMHSVLFIQVTATQTICHLDTWQLQCHLLSTLASGCPSTASHHPSAATWAPEWLHWQQTLVDGIRVDLRC